MIDNNTIEQIQERMDTALKRIHGSIAMVAIARQVKEFNSDMRKKALAISMHRYIERGESMAGAEALARATPEYNDNIKQLAEEYTNACRVIAESDANYATFEATRSLLAMSRESLKTLEG